MQIQPNTRVTIDSVFQPVLSTLSRLVRRVTGEGGASAEVNQLQTLLETLPLGSDEFGIACNRLRNAQRYLQANEAGAARWELKYRQLEDKISFKHCRNRALGFKHPRFAIHRLLTFSCPSTIRPPSAAYPQVRKQID